MRPLQHGEPDAAPVIDVFLRTYVRDIVYAEFNLRSFHKFNGGGGVFRKFLICVPTGDAGAFFKMVAKLQRDIGLADVVKLVTTTSVDRGGAVQARPRLESAPVSKVQANEEQLAFST